MNNLQHSVTATGWEPVQAAQHIYKDRVKLSITVTTGEDNYSHTFYASANGLGMSKSYATRERAINELLRCAGHDNISIEKS